MTNFFSTGLVRRAFLVLCAWCAVPVVASAQDLSLSGVVSDQNGAPLIGVTVFEKDGSNGTATNQDGRYTIRLQKVRRSSSPTSDTRRTNVSTTVKPC